MKVDVVLKAAPDVPPWMITAMDAPSGAAKTLHRHIQLQFTKLYDIMCDEQYKLGSGIDTDDFIKVVVQHLRDVLRLSGLPGGQKLAFDLLVWLGEKSFGDIENCWRRGKGRPGLYKELDEAMLEIAQVRWATDKKGLSEAIARIESTGRYIKQFHLNHYFLKSLEYLRARLHLPIEPDVPPHTAAVMDARPDAAQKLDHQMRLKIEEEYETLSDEQGDKWSGVNPDDFIKAMVKYLPDVRRLASLPGGINLAFDLLIVLGENSFGEVDNGNHGLWEGCPELYQQLDDAMFEVVGLGGQGGKEEAIERIEKTRKYLSGYGIEPYFEQSLACLRARLGLL